MYCTDFSNQGLYYGLKIMKSILVPVEKHLTKKEAEEFIIEKEQFFKRFTECDGFTLLCKTFKELEVKKITQDVVWLSIFQMITSILEMMLEDEIFLSSIIKEKQDLFMKSTRILLDQTTEVLATASSNVEFNRDLSDHLFTSEEVKTLSEDRVKNIKEEYEIVETDFFYYLIELLDSCLKVNTEGFDIFYQSDFIKNGVIVKLLASHPNSKTIKKVAESLVDFCSSFKDNVTINPNPVHFFIKLLDTNLNTILSQDVIQHTEYFNCWDKMIRLVNASDITKDVLNSVKVAKDLLKTITSRQIIEDDISVDSILSGCMLMLKTLDELFHKDIKDECPEIYSKEFLNFLLKDGLFSRERPDSNNDDLTYPLCKNKETRKNALMLLSQLFGETHMEYIASFIEPLIKNGSWRTNKREKWFIQSSKLSHRKTHVGLVNLGCTCYMNSLMQQLFMCPYFRSFICSATDQKRNTMPLEDNVLYHSKYLFANLIKTKMPTYNPIVFFNSIKDYTGEPMPTNEQRDVDEFLNIYMDKIEQNIIGSEDETHLKSIFGGAFAQELICKDCPHRSTREEPYLAVSLEIKNKNNIKEALELFIQGEMLEGDNAYYCERCDKKIDTLKRCCIKKLPNMLILSLKRFEFDLETLTRYKLNSYCEYYDELDMKDYCQETLAKKELLKKMQEEKLTYEMLTEDQKAVHDYSLPENYYNYKLKGTVVHYGTAEAGHYYSYIKERGTDKWFEFNDTTIRDYDPADLPEDTFGGKLKHERKIIQGGKQYIETEKLNNAYVLIYEREQFIDNNKMYELNESDRVDLASVADTYALKPKALKIEKEILDELMTSYDRHWISNKMFDENFILAMSDMCLKSCALLQMDSERRMKQAMDVDDSPDELSKLKFTTLFLLGVVMRSDSNLHYASQILPYLRDTLARDHRYAEWLLSCFCRKHTINELLAS